MDNRLSLKFYQKTWFVWLCLIILSVTLNCILSNSIAYKNGTWKISENVDTFELISIPGSTDTSNVDNEASKEEIIEDALSDSKISNEIGLISLTTLITRGEYANVKVRGLPNTEYTITVYYPSGEANAWGLNKKISDEGGIALWSWKIGSRTTKGEHYLVIEGGGASLRCDFTVK